MLVGNLIYILRGGGYMSECDIRDISDIITIINNCITTGKTLTTY